ncbi:hypothetical protein EV1_003679 [Malus domestica]
MLTDKSNSEALKLRSSQASRFPKNQESLLRSSFIVLPRSSPDGLWINNHPPIQDQAPTALEESTIVHHPFIQDQAPMALWINKRRQIHTSNRSSRSSPKALEDPFITVLQDQAQTPLKIRSSPLFKIKPQTTLEETFILKIKPQRLLEDPLKSTFKDQAHGPLKKLPTVHPRSSLDGPWINETPTNQHLTEIKSEDQI